MSNNRHGSAQRAARPVSQDQFPPPNPWPTVNIITPDCTRRPMELQLIRFGQALMQLRYAYIEMLHHFNQLKSCPVDIHPGHARTASDQSQGSNQNPANICSTTVSNEMQEPETTQIMSSTESEDTLYSDDDTVYAKKESHEPSTNNVPSGMLKTFDQMMDELPQRRKRPYTKLKQSEVNKMRKMGACYDCRANKRKSSRPPFFPFRSTIVIYSDSPTMSTIDT
ncbi:hypothetical protein K432DRAFT_405233 [Lepidopterella palustris CBS 459.81]|uniref:Uncharacterized protein n=1 Tax=Lepidopterella palustris CBS 459.81 TaxID=1314670 RepID=A0A8E2JET1_9PEZI|nr:hypothetical protein K432DRAFT_405233 [Lepidopterella palustris CBS 459.81]